MNACLRFAPLVGSRPGELLPEEARSLDAHLAACAACRARAADAAAVSSLLVEALTAEARAADLDAFADGVLARLAGAPAAGPGGSAALPLELALRGRAGGRPTSGRTGPLRGLGTLGRGLRAVTVRHPFAAAVLVPAAVAALLALVYLEAGRPGDRSRALVEVSAEGRSATVLETADGPIVLLGEDDPVGS